MGFVSSLKHGWRKFKHEASSFGKRARDTIEKTATETGKELKHVGKEVGKFAKSAERKAERAITTVYQDTVGTASQTYKYIVLGGLIVGAIAVYNLTSNPKNTEIVSKAALAQM